MIKLIEETPFNYIIEYDNAEYELSKSVLITTLFNNDYYIASPYKIKEKSYYLRNYIEFNHKKYIIVFSPGTLQYAQLEEINVEDNNPLGYNSIDGVLYEKDKLTYYPPYKKQEIYIVPSHIKSAYFNSITRHIPKYLKYVYYKNKILEFNDGKVHII